MVTLPASTMAFSLPNATSRLWYFIPQSVATTMFSGETNGSACPPSPSQQYEMSFSGASGFTASAASSRSASGR